jgi:hypothetical protein
MKGSGWPRVFVIAAIPKSSRNPMNDHHFSYPRVVPIRGTTISAHAVQAPAPPVTLRPVEPRAPVPAAVRPVQPLVPQSAVPASTATTLAA